jgi:AcrR family transcriptional regulator
MMYDATNRSHKIIRRGLRSNAERRTDPTGNHPQGGAGAALSDLMKATGLEKGGICRHFDSRQQLAVEAFEFAWKLALDTRFEGESRIALRA